MRTLEGFFSQWSTPEQQCTQLQGSYSFEAGKCRKVLSDCGGQPGYSTPSSSNTCTEYPGLCPFGTFSGSLSLHTATVLLALTLVTVSLLLLFCLGCQGETLSQPFVRTSSNEKAYRSMMQIPRASDANEAEEDADAK